MITAIIIITRVIINSNYSIALIWDDTNLEIVLNAEFTEEPSYCLALLGDADNILKGVKAPSHGLDPCPSWMVKACSETARAHCQGVSSRRP